MRIRYVVAGGHVRCRVFVAATAAQTFAQVGELVFTEAEWPALRALISHPRVEFLDDKLPARRGEGLRPIMHVPEFARVTDHPTLATDRTDGDNGAFDLESVEPGWRLAIIASDGTDPSVPECRGWEHVSVHAYRRGGAQQCTPTWREMCAVKDLFWDPEDLVMQLHPRRSAYVNLHPHTLHLWRHADIPEPPAILVGPRVEVAK